MVAAFQLCGCALTRLPWLGDRNGTTYTQEQLRADLVSLANTYEMQVNSAAETIKRTASERNQRENALLWQMTVLPRVHRLAFLPDPKQAFLATFVLSRALASYFENGDGKDLFGDQQYRAIEISKVFETECDTIAQRFLTPAQRRQLDEDVAETVRANPIRGVFTPESFVAAVQQSTRMRDRGAWVVELPMVPVKALTGVSDTAQAIQEFTDATLYLTNVAAGLPQVMRWHTELLLYDVENRDSVTSALSAWTELAESSRRVSAAAEQLPDDLRAVVGEQNAQLQQTLAETRAAIEEVEKALHSARELAQPYGTLATQVERAGTSWTELVREIRAMQSSGDDDPNRERNDFDILEYEATAREIGAASSEIRGLLVELRHLAEAPGLANSVSAMSSQIDAAETRSREVIDHAAWRAFQLLVFLLLGLAALRFATARRAR